MYKQETGIKKKIKKKKTIKKVRFEPEIEDVKFGNDLDSITGFSFDDDSQASKTFDSKYSDNESIMEDF